MACARPGGWPSSLGCRRAALGSVRSCRVAGCACGSPRRGGRDRGGRAAEALGSRRWQPSARAAVPARGRERCGIVAGRGVHGHGVARARRRLGRRRSTVGGCASPASACTRWLADARHAQHRAQTRRHAGAVERTCVVARTVSASRSAVRMTGLSAVAAGSESPSACRYNVSITRVSGHRRDDACWRNARSCARCRARSARAPG